MNFLLKNSDPVPYCASREVGHLILVPSHLAYTICSLQPTDSLPYDFRLLGSLQPPTILLTTPLLAELFGAGFTRSPQSKVSVTSSSFFPFFPTDFYQNYELRFPRVTKVYRAKERSWKDGVDLPALQKIAQDVVIPDRSDKEVRDWCNDLWGKSVSPIIKSSLMPKRKATSDARSTLNRTWTNAEKSERKRARTSDTRLFIISPDPTTHSPNLQSCQAILQTPQLTTPGNKVSGAIPYTPNSDYVPSMSRTPIADSRPSLVTHQPVSGLLSPWMAFLEHALVWFAKSSDHSSGPSHWSSNNSIPRQQRLHSIESLLTGCGWDIDDAGSAWAKRGVIFVDESDDMGKEWMSYTMEAIEERQARLINSKALSRKPIWIFDIKTWALGTCDIQNHALHCLE